MKQVLISVLSFCSILAGTGLAQVSSASPASTPAGSGQSGPFPPGPKVTVVETFDEGSNVGGWSFFGDPGNDIETIEPTGGHPGWFLHATCDRLACLDTFTPQLRSQPGNGSVFTGDYREKGVVQLGVDLVILGPDGVVTGNRPLTLILVHDSGTPDDDSDDIRIARVGPRNIPRPDGRWSSYRFRVPSLSDTLPQGWVVLQGTGDDDLDWNRLITDVDQVRFMFGDPDLFYLLQQWEIGVDNVNIRQDP